MNDNEINDKRIIKDFKGISFSKYKKSLVKKQLLLSLNKKLIEESFYWSIELICAGHYSDLWDTILLYMSRYIHIANPKLAIYIDLKFENFKNILNNGYVDNELELRNNIKIRKIFGELIGILCFSKKKYAFQDLSVKDHDDFDITNLSSKLKAPNIEYAKNIYRENDPKEIFIAINEFLYNISKESLDCISATYWVEWIIQYEIASKQQKNICICETRTFVKTEDKYRNDIIWLVWEAIFFESKKDKLINKIILSLFNLFCIKFTSSCKKKRKYLIYAAIYFLTENINHTIPIIENKVVLDNILNQINLIYKEVKKNEIKPDTDYLFNGLERSNTEKSIEKLEKLNSILNIN